MRLNAAAAGLVLLTGLAACTAWVPREVPAPPAAVRTIHGPARVTFFSRDTVTLLNIVIATDSLFGRSPDAAIVRYAFPLRNVAKIEEQVKQPVRTMLLGAAILVALFTL